MDSERSVGGGRADLRAYLLLCIVRHVLSDLQQGEVRYHKFIGADMTGPRAGLDPDGRRRIPPSRPCQ